MKILLKCRALFLCCAFALFFISSASAGPVIKIADSTVFNAGVITEGKEKTLKHVFIVKNTGDAPLQIKQVRPG